MAHVSDGRLALGYMHVLHMCKVKAIQSWRLQSDIILLSRLSTCKLLQSNSECKKKVSRHIFKPKEGTKMNEKYDWKSSPTNSIDESSDDRMEAGGAKLPITYDDLPIEEIEASSWRLHRGCSRGIGIALFAILAIVLVGLGVGFSFYDKSGPISALNSTLEVAPSYAPTSAQTSLPSAPSSSPSASPTASASPSISPSSMPSISPSDGPSSEPSSGPTGEPTALPSSEPTKDPTREPTDDPTSEPTMDPTRKPTDEPAEDADAATVVLKPGHKLERGDYVSSPSGHYRVGLSSDGNFKLKDTFDDDKVIWDADISSGYKAYMQEDGNFIIRDRNGKNLWSTETADYKNAKLTVDNSGTVGVVYKDSYVWMQGVPQGSYEGPNKDIKFPIRGTFYYSWYPETWEVSSGAKARFKPDKFGYYNSADPKVIEAHLDEFDYGNIELGIISWWGQSTNNDRARISLLQKMTLDLHYDIKWCVYYEEMGKKKSEDDVREDLAYLKKWFAWHPTWPHVDGKPVIFVYHNSGCSNVKRWMKASDGEWHVVLKIFGGYKDCSAQPDSWHQYAPAKDVVEKKGEYFVISPGFWHAGRSKPSLPRLSKSKFCDNVQDMVDSREPWQLVATFNEGGEGTLIEPSKKWESDSGYGYYLDCLHKIK
eukprot:scaffold6638_cov127-Cylindrotheca_fusiformis.AAC.12